MKETGEECSMRQARVYTASVDCLKDPQLYQRALSLLPPERKADADRMKIESGKCLSAGAGLLLMAALSDYLGREDAAAVKEKPSEEAEVDGEKPYAEAEVGGEKPCAEAAGEKPSAEAAADEVVPYLEKVREYSSLRIGIGEHGKPYLQDYPEVHFNLSHAGNRVMCVVSPEPAGCDIEGVESREHVESVIRCLAESEQEAARASCVDFFRIWTLKESILKLSGKGLLIRLNAFAVSLDPLSVQQDFIREKVWMKEYEDFRPSYCCSAALTGVRPPEQMIRVDLEAVLE